MPAGVVLRRDCPPPGASAVPPAQPDKPPGRAPSATPLTDARHNIAPAAPGSRGAPANAGTACRPRQTESLSLRAHLVADLLICRGRHNPPFHQVVRLR